MIPDRLYDLAFQYRKTKLWKKLWDSHLFAARFSDGGIGYCCVMGMNGDLNAIAVYPGQQGLDSLRMLYAKSSAEDKMAQLEEMRSQDCMMLSFVSKSELHSRDLEELKPYCEKNGVNPRGKNAWPQFERFRPGYERWYLEDETDQRRMAEALEIAIGVAGRLIHERNTPEQLGLYEGEPFDKEIPLYTLTEGGLQSEAHPLPPVAPVAWPPVVIDDDLSRAKLGKAPRKGEWAARLFRYFTPVSKEYDGEDQIAFDDLTEAPFYPWALLLIDARSGIVLSACMSDSPEDYSPDFAASIVETVTKCGLPHKIAVTDDRTAQALSRFCDDFGVVLQRKKRCKLLQEALDSLLEHALSDADISDDEIDMMFDVLGNADLVRTMPDEMFVELLREVDFAGFPENVKKVIYNEAVRRKMLK